MKNTFAAILFASMSLQVLAQNPPAPQPMPPPTPVPAAPAAKPAPPVDPEAVKKAEAALKESAKTYAQAKALTDKITFEVKEQGGTHTETITVAMQGSNAARVIVNEITATAVKPALFIEKEGISDKYAEFAIESDIAGAFENQIGLVPPQLIAASTDDVDKLLEAWTFHMLPRPKIASYAVRTDGGMESQEIAVTGEGGEGTIWINAKTHLVNKSHVHVKPDGAPEGFELDATITFAPKVMDKIEPAIAFDAGKRQKVSSIEDLKIDLTGKPAPDFTLESLDGDKVTLSDLKGSVVILDFWATWCVPCKMALPKLDEFTKWARENNKSVKVYAVDVWERAKPAERKQKVSEFWTSKGYAMPTLLDLDDAVAKKYGFDGIPTTVIIDPKGNIFRVHNGFNPNMPDELKKDVEEVMAQGK